MEESVACPKGKAAECIESPDGFNCACCGCAESVAEIKRLKGENDGLHKRVEELEGHIKETLTTAAEDTKKLREEKHTIWEKWQQAEARADSERERADLLAAMLSEERGAHLESEARVERLEEMLRRVEWIPGLDFGSFCPWCRWGKTEGHESHSPDCAWVEVMGSPRETRP